MGGGAADAGASSSRADSSGLGLTPGAGAIADEGAMGVAAGSAMPRCVAQCLPKWTILVTASFSVTARSRTLLLSSRSTKRTKRRGRARGFVSSLDE